MIVNVGRYARLRLAHHADQYSRHFVDAVNARVLKCAGEQRFGLLLSVLFLVAQGPDVALSQLAVGTSFVP